ncbi:MAG: DNA translocase FtsK 4TM domain-containing protein [Candidatus Promineifilaceae bacterium]
MTRSRSTPSRRRRKEPAAAPQTWDERFIRGITPWKWEIAGFLLFLIAVVTLLGMLNIIRSGPLDPWTRMLRQFTGWGVYPLCLTLASIGLYFVLRRLEIPVVPRSSQIIGIEIIVLVVLALSHLLIGKGLNGALQGKGGGLIGWALSEPIMEFLGPPLTGVMALITLVFGAALVANIGYGDVIMWLNRTSIRLQIWSDELDTDVAERQAQIEAKREREARPSISGSDTTGASTRSMSNERTGRDQSTAARPTPSPNRNIQLPPIDLLEEGTILALSESDIDEKKRTIEQTLIDFGLPATVTEVRKGPAVTQFGVLPGYIERSGPGGEVKQYKVRVGQIAALQKDLALALQVSRVRIEAPVPGRGIVGVEVPNSETNIVHLRAIIESDSFQNVKSPLAVGLGRDVSGAPVASDLGALPHLLIAGTTGSGKSVCLNALITCLVFNNPPERLRLVMIDPKKVEFIRFNGLPHLLGNVETEGKRIIGVLRWLTVEMDRRYQVFEEVGARNLQEYNQKVSRSKDPQEKRMPYIGVFIDELADLITSYPGDVERTLCRLAQMARATGIHLVVATQRPSTDVITGLIKANFPARASFAVTSNTDSRVILDSTGAEQLLGKGDMLFLSPDASAPARIQGCFVSDREMEKVVEYWQQTATDVEPDLIMQETPEESPWDKMIVRSTYVSERDELLEEVIELAKKRDAISTSFIQRRLRIGYPRAARLMEALHELGLVDDPKEGGKTRRTLVSGDEDPLEDLLNNQ